MQAHNVLTLHILETAIYISLIIEGATESLPDYSHALRKCLICVHESL